MDFVLALHSHLPWVLNHGRWPHGSDWLCEAALDTYLPLIEQLRALETERVAAPLTIGVTPVRGSKNVFSELVLKRGGKVVAAAAKANEPGGGKFTYDYAPFAPTAPLTIEIVGKAKTIACTVPPDVLASFR